MSPAGPLSVEYRNKENKDENPDSAEQEPSITTKHKLSVPPSPNEEDDWEDVMPEPPDGGWGWVVMISSFFICFILDGIAYCYGIFIEDYKAFFNASTSSASLANSLLCGMYLLVGPIVGALSNKFGLRPVGVAGSILAACAFILSTFSPNISIFQLIYGVIGGFGFGMMYLPAVVGVGYYFTTKRAIATGISVCGTGIGVFCLAPLGKFLLQQLNWQSSHFILAGLILQGCIFAGLMRPLTAKRRLKSKVSASGIIANGVTNSSPDEAQANLISQDASPSSPNKTHSRHRPRTTSSMSFLASSRMVITENPSPAAQLHASAFMNTDPTTSVQNLQRPLYRKDIFYSGSVMNISPVKSHLSLKSYIASVASIPQQDRLRCLNVLPKPMADILAEMLDLSVLRNRGMIVLCAANIIGMLGFYVPLLFTAPRAESLGISGTDAALLLSIQGISNTIGRVLSGFMPLIPNVSALLVNNICVTLSGVAVLLTPFTHNFVTMAICSAGYGLFGSTLISLAPIIMCDLLGLEKLTNGFGLLCMVRGITAIAGPPLEGMLYDWSGNYDLTFYCGGSFLILCGILHFLLHLRFFKNKAG